MQKNFKIAIDGPAGSGKSTTAKLVAQKLGFTYLDTGAMYRAITYLSLKNNVINETGKIIELAKNSTLNLKFVNGKTEVLINSEDVTEHIRTFEVNSNVSDVSKIPEVRKILVEKQQIIGNNSNIVAEGRDTGTVVFPDADVKIFLVAAINERGRRRLKEFQEKGENLSLEEIIQNLSNRDKIDSTREVSPLKKADDAYIVDTSNVTIDEQVEEILKIVNEVAKKKGIANIVINQE